MVLADETRLVAAFALSLAAAFIVTPVAIAIAGRTNFHDRPIGYKAHGHPTPYLGGAAVLGGWLVGAAALGGGFARLSPILALACGLWVLGTIDDRLGLPPLPRVMLETAAAVVLWACGLGWGILDSGPLNLVLTILWVVALVNAFNLIDNIDGVAATLASVTGVAIGVLGVVNGDVALAALAFGLAGACLGFLPYNLAAPSRIFLGDGGSLPIGFVIAALLMVVPSASQVGLEAVLGAILLAGVPVIDTSLVIVSRRRAGLSVFSGGRDHITHRLHSRLGSPRNVAITLGLIQACVGAVAVGFLELGRGSVVAAWTVWFVASTFAIVLLERQGWAPDRGMTGRPSALSVSAVSSTPRKHTRMPSLVESALIVFVSLSCGLSPFLYGFYDLSVWGPITFGLLAALLALSIARPAIPRSGALVAAGSLGALWLLALLSTMWAESADQALLEACRWGVYAALFAVLTLLLRDDRLARILLGALAAGVVALGGYITIRMLAGSAQSLFLAGRLNGPLGYVNGQAGYLAMGIWPLVAFAERVSRRLWAGVALGGATMLGGLAVLGQSRAALFAFAVSALVLLAIAPGRTRRVWMLTFVVGGVGFSLAPLLDVYESSRATGTASLEVLRTAAVVLLGAAGLVALLWAALASAAASAFARIVAFKGRRGLIAAWTPIAALLIAAALVAFAQGDPIGKVQTEYRAFVELDPGRGESTRLTAGGGNRFDYWAVALSQFESSPIRGIGAGNYDVTYFRDRSTTEDIRQPHSLELQVLSELGIAGALLLSIFLSAILVGFVRRSRAARADIGQRTVVVAGGGVFLVWLVHTSVDWLHLIPGLTGMALCAAAALTGPWAGRGGFWSWRRSVVVAATTVLVLTAAIVTGRVALADHHRERAQQSLDTDPARAVNEAKRSLELNDDSLPAYFVSAAAWARLGDYDKARAALVEATRREPHDFVPWALIGDLATRAGDHARARRAYARAAVLNPRDVSLRALTRVR